MSDTFRNQETIQELISKLDFVVTPDSANWLLDLEFNLFDEVDQDLWSFRFESREEEPCETSKVISYNQCVLLVMYTGYGRWTTKINT